MKNTKPIRGPYLLTLVCIYETTRQTGIGPTFDEIKSMLVAIYNIVVSKDELEKILDNQSPNFIQMDINTNRYYPMPAGVRAYWRIEKRVIPPQTVAQPERKRA